MQVLQRVDDEAVVGEDRLPGEGPDQVRDEEGRDEEEQEQVLPAAAAEGDPVCDRVADDERECRRDACVLERPDELRAVVPDRVPVVPPRPGERVAEVDVARLQRLVGEIAERNDEERRQPQDARREQQVRREAPMSVEEAQACRLFGSDGSEAKPPILTAAPQAAPRR